MPVVLMQARPQVARDFKTVSLRRMLTGLMRADVFRRLAFYGTLCSLMVSALIYFGSTRQVFAAGPERVGLPWDWSHEHLLFSKTDDPAVLAIIQTDPRAFHQWLRRDRTASQWAADGVPSSERGPQPRSESRKKKRIRKRDWGVSLGSTSFTAVNAPNAMPVYPAKYTFDINATPDCENDYVAFPTGADGTKSTNAMTPNGQASIIGYNNLYSSQGGATGLCGTAGPSVAWAYINAGCPATSTTDPILSSPVISLDGTKVAWVTSTGKVQIVTYGVGFVSGVNESVLAPACIGSVASGGDGASLQTLTLGNAKNNPTSGVTLSAIFVDYNSDSAYVGDDDGYLHKISPFFTAGGTLQETATAAWQASQPYSVGDLVVDTNGFIQQCTTAGTSGSGAHPAWSNSWGATTPDNTVTWTNLGSGGGWPVYVTGSSTHADNNKLTGPIFDFVSKNIFIGDEHGSLFYVLDPGVSTAVGSCANGATAYPCLGKPGTTSSITAAGAPQIDCSSASPGPTCMVMSNRQGFTDPVAVDTSNKLVITQFSNADGASATVEQTNTSLSVFNSANLAGQVNLSHHTGAFDNTYYSTPASGFYYVCGPDSDGKETDLYRVGFISTAGTVALGTVDAIKIKLTTTGNSGNCSPLTEIYNTSTPTPKDWLFLSVDNHGKFPAPSGLGGCANSSCVVSFSLGSSFSNPFSFYGPGVIGDIAQDMNGTGGIIVDNDAAVTTYGQASSIYFMPQASNLNCGDGTSLTGCAVKLTQAGLN
jgi:hypothetical protein